MRSIIFDDETVQKWLRLNLKGRQLFSFTLHIHFLPFHSRNYLWVGDAEKVSSLPEQRSDTPRKFGF